MPKSNQPAEQEKPDRKGKATAPKKAITPPRDVVYPDVRINGVPIPEKNLTITVEMLKQLLGWETESEFAARKRAEAIQKGVRDADKKVWKLPDDDVILTDFHGEKVACWNNPRNREFDQKRMESYAQDILDHKWRFNGEAMIVGRTSMTISMQHRAAAVIFAEQRRTSDQEKDHWASLWDGPITIKAVLVTGIEEDQETLTSLDNVKPRTEADVLFTSDIFQKFGREARRECSKMLATANDLVWQRTNAKEDVWHQYQTHSTSVDFLDRHKKLRDCVIHLFEENKDRQLTKIKLSAGKCSGLMYLFACSGSDIDEYRNADPRSEKVLNWDNWEKAEEFFSLIGSSPDMDALREALRGLSDEDTGSGGTDAEKQSLLVKAWLCFLEGGELTSNDLELEYEDDIDGNPCLVNPPVIGGIDQGLRLKPPDKAPPTKEEIEAEKARIKSSAAYETVARLNAGRSQRLPDEVPAPEPIQHDADGKPPPPKLLAKPLHKKEDKPAATAAKPAPKPAKK